ncbi:hypothetical protein SMD22_01655 (plasmid) [Brevibacillus halotolerans]|nr:hypothetical protein SMD22_01655 [Brevibacillus halotolerans]
MKNTKYNISLLLVFLVPVLIVASIIYGIIILERVHYQVNWLEERYCSTEFVEFVRDVGKVDLDDYPKPVSYIYMNNNRSPLFGDNKYYSFQSVPVFVGYRYILDAVQKQGSYYVYITGSKKGEIVNLNDDHKISILRLYEPKGEVNIFASNGWEAQEIRKYLSSELSWFSIIKEQEEKQQAIKKESARCKSE